MSCLEGFPEEGAAEMRAKRRTGVCLRKGGGKGWGTGCRQRDQHMHRLGAQVCKQCLGAGCVYVCVEGREGYLLTMNYVHDSECLPVYPVWGP